MDDAPPGFDVGGCSKLVTAAAASDEAVVANRPRQSTMAGIRYLAASAGPATGRSRHGGQKTGKRSARPPRLHLTKPRLFLKRRRQEAGGGRHRREKQDLEGGEIVSQNKWNVVDFVVYNTPWVTTKNTQQALRFFLDTSCPWITKSTLTFSLSLSLSEP